MSESRQPNKGMDRLRILVVSPYFPLPMRSGGKVRVYNIIKELAELHEVEVVCGVSPESAPHVSDMTAQGVTVHGVRRRRGQRRSLFRHLRFLPTSIPFSMVDPDEEIARKVVDVWKVGEFDVLQVEFLAMAYAADNPCFDGRRFITLHFPAAESYRRSLSIMPPYSPRYWYRQLELLKLGRYESQTMRRFGHVFVTSNRDRDLLASSVPDVETVVVNNGVDTEFYKPRRAAVEPELIISTCNFQTEANVDGVLHFLRAVWPLVLAEYPEARYEVIGREPPREVFEEAAQVSGVTVVGEVEDVRPYFARARASTVIMRAGSGTKIRLFTSLAMGVPVIATPLGAEGVSAAPRGSVLVGGSPEDLATHVCSVLGTERPSWQAGRDFVKAHHSWRAAALEMTAAYSAALPD